MFERRATKIAGSTALALLLGAFAGAADAVPSFARQTGQDCVACHVSWPELTPYGRYFKLTGYTIGKAAITSEGPQYVPMAIMAQGSVTNTKNNKVTDPDTGDTTTVTQRNNSFVFSGGSLFLAGKINDYVGGFVQWTYDNLATVTDGTLGGHSSVDNIDLRGAYKYSPVGAGESKIARHGAGVHPRPFSATGGPPGGGGPPAEIRRRPAPARNPDRPDRVTRPQSRFAPKGSFARSGGPRR